MVSYNLAIFDGKSAGTLSKSTSRHTSVSSSTLPEHLQLRASQTAHIFRTDKPYEPYCSNALSYNSCASRSESDVEMTTDSRMRPSLMGLLWPAANIVVIVLVVVAVIGTDENVLAAIVDVNGVRDDVDVDEDDDDILCVVNGREDVDDDGDDDDDSADVELQ